MCCTMSSTTQTSELEEEHISPSPSIYSSALSHPLVLRKMSRVVEMAIKVLIGVVFLGWMMIWILLPTNVYRKKWRPKISSDTKSTYFGSLGKNLLILAFPIFFIAVLGAVYLHLEQKRRKKTDLQSAPKNGEHLSKAWKRPLDSGLEVWKRPVLVKGPLGILTLLELAFLVMFVALVVWHLAFFISSGFSNLKVVEGEKVWEAKLESAGLRLGLVGNLCLAFLFFPVTRWSSLLPLVGLTSESSIRYHVWMGHITMVLFTAHGICYVVYWASIDKISEMIEWATTGASNVAGELSLLSGLIMWATTFPSIRRKAFEVFFYTHQLYVLFLVFFGYHVGMGHFFWNLPGVYLFLLDRYLRFLQSQTSVRLLSARVLPSSFELTFAKSPTLDYTALSVIFLRVPSVSKLQWHPFTVSSSSTLEPEKLSIVIKNEGKWSSQLHDLISSASPPSHLQVSVEGPYGHNYNRFLKYDSLVLVSGGSGITPFIGIIRELLHISTTRPTPEVHLICAFKNSDDLAMLDLLLPVAGNYSSGISLLSLRVEAFVTRESEPPTSATNKNKLRMIWFKPTASESPITPILGPNGWLWLAAVISCSFVTFLLLMGILTQYYFYPREKGHSSHGGHSPRTTTKATLIMLFMFISFMLVGGIAVLWNKLMAKKEIQVKNVNRATPQSSPVGPAAYNTDVELESLPCEPLEQATKVRFGGRPDLKKILLDHDGEEPTGVFVSGPSSMRREVASICGSGMMANLRFESVSFTW